MALPNPGRRRLRRPGRPARGMLLAGVVALAGAAAITIAGGLITITAGLLVVAGIIGWAVAVAVGYGAGPTLRGRTRARSAC